MLFVTTIRALVASMPSGPTTWSTQTGSAEIEEDDVFEHTEDVASHMGIYCSQDIVENDTKTNVSE